MPVYWGDDTSRRVRISRQKSPELLIVVVGVWAATMYAAYTLGWWMGVYNAF